MIVNTFFSPPQHADQAATWSQFSGSARFVQRFGSALNAHTHLHSWVTGGLFSPAADGTLRYCARPTFASERLC